MTTGEDGSNSKAKPPDRQRARAKSPRYIRLTVELPSSAEEEAAVVLWDLGSCGSEITELRSERLEVRAYFRAEARQAVGMAAIGLADLGARRVNLARVDNEDWLAGYREAARPLAVGERFLVDPREPGKPLSHDDERFVLRLPARNAFGTGSHPSTELALRLLEGARLKGRHVLDVGYGSGILCFAALLLGAHRASGVENDLEAALVGGDNRTLNKLRPQFIAGELAALKPARQFDVIVANLLPHRLLPLLPRFEPLLVDGGEMILSGFPESEGKVIADGTRAIGFEARRSLVQEGWGAFAVERSR